MDKFTSQQAALRSALALVLGTEPVKGALVIDDEQRAKVGEVMMGWLKDGRWSIKDGTRAAQHPLEYITGKRPTDLIQAWTKPRAKKEGSADKVTSKSDEIKAAVDKGLITAEDARELMLAMLKAG